MQIYDLFGVRADTPTSTPLKELGESGSGWHLHPLSISSARDVRSPRRQ